LLPVNKELLTQGGAIQSAMDVSLKGDELAVSGDLHLLGLDLLEQGQKQSLMKWNSADVNRFVYESSKRSGASLSIEELSVSQPVLQFEIDEKDLEISECMFAAILVTTDEKIPLSHRKYFEPHSLIHICIQKFMDFKDFIYFNFL
jgi:hypothetical protein